jgi:2,3-bisphosphoglycerate-dependent phosphoglycerate mutase
MYKLVLLRHSESLWNKENKFTGWVDVELSDFGREQAKKAGQALKEAGFFFDIAFTSVLRRATETLDIVLKEMGSSNVIIEKSPNLNERRYGALQGVDKQEAIDKFGLEQVMIWRRGYKVKPPGGESLEDVFLRVVFYFQEKIAPAILGQKNVLVVAHGNSLRALVKMLNNVSDKDIEKLEIPIGVPIVYELDKNLKPVAFSELLC